MKAPLQNISVVPADIAGRLSKRRDQDAYLDAGTADAAWFAARPSRRFRLRKAVLAERRLYGPPTTHMVIEQKQPGVRFRRPVYWAVPGPLPDDDAVLARLLAGAVITGEEGRA
jgi:hypothetical protein